MIISKFYFTNHKADQIGPNKEESRHVYLNPKNPVVCPIQALPSYLLDFPETFVNAKKLFLGND